MVSYCASQALAYFHVYFYVYFYPKAVSKRRPLAHIKKLHKLMLQAFFAVVMTLGAVVSQAEVISLLSDETIEELESVRLAIRHVGTRQSETLDLTILERDFHVMGTNTNSQYQYINGKAESWVDYQITLQPKRAGTLTIPPIRVGNERSKAMRLEVRKLTNSTRAKIAALIFYEQEFSTTEVYVQSQLLMTRKLFYMDGVQLYGGQPGAPEIDDALVITLGENRNTISKRNGKSYGVIEQRYAVFPQSSGALVIPPIQLSASVRLVDRGRVARKAVRVSTQSQQINVLPIPNEFPKDQPWLPALDLTLEQNFGASNSAANGKNIGVGENLQRTIELNVYGNTGAIAPPLLGDLDASKFKQYPSPALIEEDINGSTVVGIRIESSDIVAITPGSHLLPGIDVYWWDTENKVVRQTSVAQAVLTVYGVALPEASAISPDVQNQPVQIVTTPLVMQRELDYRDKLGKILLGLLFAVALWRLFVGVNRDKAPASRNSQLTKTMSTYNAAVKNEDLMLIRSTLQNYLRVYFNTSLGESWQQFVHSSAAAKAYADALDSAKYSDATVPVNWRHELTELGEQAIAHLNAKQTTQPPHLPELYPQH
jgi:hypothetical protein